MSKSFMILLVFGLSVASASCQERAEKFEPVSKIDFEKEGDWRKLFDGIDSLKLTVKKPRLMSVHVIRIALDTPGLEFVCTGDNGERPEETDAVFTSTFLKQEKCQIAINAGVFSSVTEAEGTGKNILGLHISEGKVVSPWEDGYQAIALGKGNDANFLRNDPQDYSKIETAVSGFKVVLWDGKVRQGDQTIHPRSLVGLSKDRKQMFWMVIDGRQRGFSEGATKVEAGQLMKQLGAYSALNLDGGGTTTLVMQAADGSAKVLNRPIHGGTPGKERPSASHLGVRVRER